MRSLLGLWGAAAFLALSLPTTGQVGAESYSRLVEARLKDMRSLSRLAGDTSDDLASANRKLERQLADDTKQSPAWKDLMDAQGKFDSGMQGFAKLLHAVVAADGDLLGRLDRSAGIGTRAVADNLAASAQLQRGMAQALSGFVGLLEQQASAAKGLPETARDLPEFHYLKKVRDAVTDALDDSGRMCRKERANTIRSWPL